MFDFNKDVATRDNIIFGEYDEEKYMGGARYFESVSTETIKKLMELNYLDPNESQNDSPTAGEMIEFAERYGDYEFGGYVISSKRNDYRVNLTTISKLQPVEYEEEMDFIKKFRFADEFDVDGELYAWYD